MWPQWVQKLTGSEPAGTTTERLLREQNDLLRLLLQQQGLKSPLPPRVGVGPVTRKRTEADVTHLTRASIAASQARQREASRMDALNDRPIFGTSSPSESEPS